MDVFKVDATTYGWILPLCLWVLLVLVNWTLFYWENLAVSKWFSLIVQSVISTFDCIYKSSVRIVSNNWYAVYFLCLFGYF
jgi:hypothetical protein